MDQVSSTAYGSLAFSGSFFRFFIVPLKTISAAIKHGLLLLFLSLSTGWFVLDIVKGYNFPKDLLIYSASEAGSQTGMLLFWNNALKFFEQNLPLLSVVYLLVIIGLFANFSRYFIYARRVQTQGLMKPAVDLRLQVSRLASNLGITRKVDVWLSELIDTPMIIGFLKPTILLPLASVNQLSMLQMEAILLHELAHIRRNDYLINIYISSLRILFFFILSAGCLLNPCGRKEKNPVMTGYFSFALIHISMLLRYTSLKQ